MDAIIAPVDLGRIGFCDVLCFQRVDTEKAWIELGYILISESASGPEWTFGNVIACD